MKALLIFFTYVLISGVVYSQGGTAIDRYQQYANYFEEYLPLGLDTKYITIRNYRLGFKQVHKFRLPFLSGQFAL